MPMYNLNEYNKNYRKTARSLWNYFRNEPNNPPFNPSVGNNLPTVNYNADPITNSAWFRYKNSITGKTLGNDDDNDENGNRKRNKDVEIIVPLKHLGNFWRTLDIQVINCDISYFLVWSKNYVWLML